MHTDPNTRVLFSMLSKDMNADELLLSYLQINIAAEISIHRQKMGLNQKQFAEAMGVSQGLVSKWESGETNFTLSTLVSIAQKLDLKLQSPIVPTPAKVCVPGKGAVTVFPAKNAWSSTAYAPPHGDFRINVADTELEEM